MYNIRNVIEIKYYDTYYEKATNGTRKVNEYLNYRNLTTNFNKTIFMNFLINNIDLISHFCNNNIYLATVVNSYYCRTLQ